MKQEMKDNRNDTVSWSWNGTLSRKYLPVLFTLTHPRGLKCSTTPEQHGIETAMGRAKDRLVRIETEQRDDPKWNRALKGQLEFVHWFVYRILNSREELLAKVSFYYYQ